MADETNFRKMAERDPSGFVVLGNVVPGIIQEIRYHSTYNFIGDRIDGYEEPVALLTREAARALTDVAREMELVGYRLKVFDAYRPATAVKRFVTWGLDDLDMRMKPFFYPDLKKETLFERGYIATRSSHSRGSTVDLTLLEMATGRELDMGSPFDLFDERSHPSFTGVTNEQYQARMLLQQAMVRGGFVPYECEGWHFTLADEPYPDRAFSFPVAVERVRA